MKGRLVALVALVYGPGALAHVGDRGMDYGNYKDRRGISCCGNTDCQPAADYVDSGPDLVRLLVDGIWFTVPRYFVIAEDATDGRAHWCGRMISVGTQGERAPVTACVILPPRNT